MKYYWNQAHILNEIKKIKENKRISNNDKINYIANYEEILDILSFAFNNKKEKLDNIEEDNYLFLIDKVNELIDSLLVLKDILSIKKLFTSKEFRKYLNLLKQTSIICDTYKLDMIERPLPKRELKTNKIIKLGYNYYDSFKDRNIIDIYDKIIKSNKTYLLNRNMPNFDLGGICNYFIHNDETYIMIRKENTIYDLFTFIHEMEHALYFKKHKYNINENIAELPSCASTYFLVDFCNQNEIFSKEELDTIILKEMCVYLTWLPVYYDNYFIYNQKSYFKTILHLMKLLNANDNICKYYDTSLSKFNFTNMLSQVFAKYVYTTYNKDDAVKIMEEYLLNKRKIEIRKLEETLEKDKLEIKKLIKSTNTTCKKYKK